MAGTASFDISTGADLQEVDNAVNQATKEVAQRYDFKGSKAAIAFDRAQAALTLVADDDFKMRALLDVLQTKLVKRSEEHTSELQSLAYLVCRLLLEKKKQTHIPQCHGVSNDTPDVDSTT